MKLYDSLNHLTPKEVETLILRYYRLEKVSDLLKEYKLGIKPHQLLKFFPPKISNVKCPTCKKNLTSKYHSREGRKNKPECSKCGYVEN